MAFRELSETFGQFLKFFMKNCHLKASLMLFFSNFICIKKGLHVFSYLIGLSALFAKQGLERQITNISNAQLTTRNMNKANYSIFSETSKFDPTSKIVFNDDSILIFLLVTFSFFVLRLLTIILNLFCSSGIYSSGVLMLLRVPNVL